MDLAQTRARSQPALSFEDGFGRRQQVASAGKDPVEVLVLKREHLAVPGFEAAVRERIEQVARFRHDSFVPIRGLARLAKAEAGLALVSDVAVGRRLSQLLETERSLANRGALMLIGQLLDALAAFHQAVPGCHGSLAPERMVLTSDGRLLVTNHVFGTALPKLPLDTAAFWQQMQITMPTGSPVFDQQTDIFQAGSIALALLLNRPLGAGYPNRVAANAGGAPLSVSSALELVPQEVGWWISRAIGRRGHEPFQSSEHARDAFATILASVDRVSARDAVLAFFSGERVVVAPAIAAPSEPRPVPSPVTATPTASVAKPAPVGDVAPVAKAMPEPQPAFVSASAATEASAPIVSAASARVSQLRQFFMPMTRQAIGVTAGILMLLTTGGAFAAKRYFTPAPPVAKGTLAVTTTPVGANVVIDGQQRGQAPMTIELAVGDHVLQVGLDGSSRTIPFKVTPGAELSQVIDLPKVVAATGQLQIRTEPSGAKVLVDGQKRGTSPTTVDNLTPGAHMVTVEGQLGAVTQEVTIESGATAALVVPLNAPQGAPVSGWIAVTAPVDVQIFEKGQLLGTNRSEKIMASVGRHDLDLVNDAIGYHASRTVTVTPGQVSAMKIELPKGTMSLNAVPWAEVWIDGVRAGETPIGNLQVAPGQHEVIFRHPELGEQRFTPTVTLNAPARVSADLRRKP
jgi:hypothetical protein